MKTDIAQQLLALNHAFYDGIAPSFSASRQQPQPGFARLLDYLPPKATTFLDVGCGDGRFGRFLQAQGVTATYTGVDFSMELLRIAATQTPGHFESRNMAEPGFLDGLGNFDVIVCLAALHHIPGATNRVHLLRELESHLAVNGRIWLSTWQFLNSERQRRKLTDWSEVGLSASDVDANDYLLTWRREGFALRYAAFIDGQETAELTREAGLQVVDQYYSDGKEGNLGLYSVLAEASK